MRAKNSVGGKDKPAHNIVQTAIRQPTDGVCTRPLSEMAVTLNNEERR